VSSKGGRFITHLKRLAGVETALANFFASGVLALGPRLGPLLWQLPASLAYDEPTVDSFLGLLPRTTAEASRLAHRHDDRLRTRAWMRVDADRPLLTEPTADHVYVRLHGDRELYVSGYSSDALDRWARRVRGWASDGLDVHVYFDNDVKVRAPFDAMALATLLGAPQRH